MKEDQVKHLIKRLARIDASDIWSANLNPAQRAALEYLGRANRFSRKPSHVAEFLGSTRGTISQTLKSLARKEYVVEVQSDTDKRSIRYDLTRQGEDFLTVRGIIDQSLDGLSGSTLDQLSKGLRELLFQALSANGQKPFGVCDSCSYFKSTSKGGQCRLLDVKLSKKESQKICHEQKPRSGTEAVVD